MGNKCDLNFLFPFSFSSFSSGADAVKYIVNHAEIAAVFCTPDKLQTVSCFYSPFVFDSFTQHPAKQSMKGRLRMSCLIHSAWRAGGRS